MRKINFSRARVGRLLATIAILLAIAPLSSATAQTAVTYDFGLICENESTSTPGTYNGTVDVSTLDGYISIPDGNTVYMWGYGFGTPDVAKYQHPGPTLCFTEGQAVTIVLHNTLPENVSMMFPGQTAVLADGQPIQASANEFVQSAATNGTVTYTFTAVHPGTFIYESGTNMQKQVQMGLFGTIIVRPTMGNNYVYDWAATQFNPINDYTILLSEIDPDLHVRVEDAVNEYNLNPGGGYSDTFDITLYHPRYWQINGRSFPDTIAPNHAAWLPTQPYGALLHIHPMVNPAIGETADKGYQEYPSAVRTLNVGMLDHPLHMHGNHVQIIGRDGLALGADAQPDLSYYKFNIMAGSGQAWDTLYRWTDVDGFDPVTNPVPYDVDTVTGGNSDTLLNPHNLNLLFKEPNFFSGSPYLGYQANKNDGTVTSYNQCGEYYQIWHSHALNEAANYEAGFGGMITLERIDPPLGSAPLAAQCAP